jgi:hypothetical protein
MTPNVSRLLIKWGVSEIIGDDLVQCKYINMRSKDGTITQRTELYPKVVREFGFPVSHLERSLPDQYLADIENSGGWYIAITYIAVLRRERDDMVFISLPMPE